MKTSIKLPKSYQSKDDAFQFGEGDNFFILENGEFICVSENNPIFEEMINAGMKTELMIYLEKKQK